MLRAASPVGASLDCGHSGNHRLELLGGEQSFCGGKEVALFVVEMALKHRIEAKDGIPKLAKSVRVALVGPGDGSSGGLNRGVDVVVALAQVGKHRLNDCPSGFDFVVLDDHVFAHAQQLFTAPLEGREEDLFFFGDVSFEVDCEEGIEVGEEFAGFGVEGGGVPSEQPREEPTGLFEEAADTVVFVEEFLDGQRVHALYADAA